MTGIDFGFGTLIVYSIFFVIFIPFITTVLISDFIHIKALGTNSYFLNCSIFILSAFLCFFIIRTFHSRSFAFLSIYSICIFILVCLRKISKTIR